MLRNLAQLESLPPRSEKQSALVERARRLLPGGTTNSIVPPDGLEFLIERGEGAYLFDSDGRRFIDFFLGAGPLVLGHAHPRLVDTIIRQAALGTHHFGLTRSAVDLAERLVRYIPSAEMVRFTGSGSEATFHALRLARAVTGRQAIIKFDGAWHGHHDLASWSLEHSPTHCPEPYPVSAGIQQGVKEEITVLPFNDPAALRETFETKSRHFAAVICEPMQRTIPPRPGFLETLRDLCDRDGTVLIFDEIVTGFRLAPGGGQERYGVLPDLTTVGKAIAGGVPLAVLLGKRNLMVHMDPATDPTTYNFHCGTFNAYALGIGCAHTTLDILVEEGGIARLVELGEAMRSRMVRMLHDENCEATVCGDGPIFHAYFTAGPVHDHTAVRASDLALAEVVHRKMYEAGVYKSSTKGYLGLCHDESHVEQLIDAMAWAIRKARAD